MNVLSPSRIQVIPNATITSQCHRANGSRSILAGTLLSTVRACSTIASYIAPVPQTLPMGPAISTAAVFPLLSILLIPGPSVHQDAVKV